MAEIEFRIEEKIYIAVAQERETVLDCALRNAIPAPYSCLEGVCTSCQAKVIRGEVESPWSPETDLSSGPILTCQVRIGKNCERLVVQY